MSKHLLCVNSPYGESMKYVRYESSSSIQSSMVVEYNRELYVGLYIDNSIFRIIKINLFTMEQTKIADISKTMLGDNIIGGMLVDDNYIYMKTLMSNNKLHIYRYGLKDNDITVFTNATATSNCSCKNGRLVWYDENTICYVTCIAYVLFNIHYLTFTTIPLTVFHFEDMCIGDKFVLTTLNSKSYDAVRFICKTTNEIVNLKLAMNGVAVACYNDNTKTFYIAQTNLITIYDETSESTVKTLSVPITDPKSINCDDRYLYITRKNSNIFYIYDLQKSTYRTLYLPWNLNNTSIPTRTLNFKGFYFLPYITLGIMNLTSDAKYKLGYKNNESSIIFNNDNKDRFVYNENSVEFHDTFVTIKDIDIIAELTCDEEDSHIKRTHMDKSKYNLINSISIIKEN